MKITLLPNDDFDKALAVNREPGTEFVLIAGATYKTKGNWYYPDWCHLGTGCKLYGNGARLVLDTANAVRSVNNVVRPDRDLNVLWTGRNVVVENLIIDGNEASLVNATDLSKTWFVTCGIRTTGKASITNVTVENIRGTYNGVATLNKEIESFGILVTGPDGGSTITNCIVQNCPENSYISAIYSGHVGPNVAKNIISNCKINIGKNNWFGYGANCNVYVSNSEIINGPRMAIYNDTDITDNVVVDNCKFANIEKLISMIIPPGVNFPKKNFKIRNTTASFVSGAARHLIEYWDKNADAASVKRQFGPTLLENVTVTLADPTTKLYVATVGSDLRPIMVVDCNIPVTLENMAGNMLVVF